MKGAKFGSVVAIQTALLTSIIAIIDTGPAFSQSSPGVPALGFYRGPISRDPYGHACIIDVHGMALPVANSSTKLYEHTVTMTNICFKKVRVRVCYRETEHCKVADLPSNEKTFMVLGYETNGTFFLLDYTEVPLGYVE
jgi:hypothetical protein